MIGIVEPVSVITSNKKKENELSVERRSLPEVSFASNYIIKDHSSQPEERIANQINKLKEQSKSPVSKRRIKGTSIELKYN